MSYTYFISYSKKPKLGSGLGFGCTTVTIQEPISGDKDLLKLIKFIQNKAKLHDHEVVPIYLILLKKGE
jgi:hypothetical protein